MKYYFFVFLTVFSWLSALRADELWKCEDPRKPLRFATSDDAKAKDPPCNKWIQIRGLSQATAAALEGEAFRNAGDFLHTITVHEGGWQSFPRVSTARLHSNPEKYARKHLFRTVLFETAPLGSLVIYDGLGGVLVETREKDGDPWERQVLYPSMAVDFTPVLSDEMIEGKAKPIVIAAASPEPPAADQGQRPRRTP